ncbi:hypothetical protein Tco_0938638 [Tanacetum coccineum]|uniref:Gag-Pol polyprotein n=1 Tax=Tanacetum coccineum TaxID=301880 RepID=A0ABQ5DKH6_9ASTR
MSTQQEIYVDGFENRPPMLNKENYVPWSSCDQNCEVPVNENFHEQTNDELTKKELKQVKSDDQAIQTILLDLPEDIYAAGKNAKLFNEWKRFTSTDGELIESYYHRFSKFMNDFKRNKHFQEKIANNLKFLNSLQPEWSRHVTIVHQTKDLHTADYTQFYDFLKYNQKEVDDLRAERLAKTHDPLALMENSNNPVNYLNYMQQPMPNPENIIDPTNVMNMELVLMAKAFKLNYSTPTNNNQRISSNPRNRQIAQPGMNMGQDRQLQMVIQNAVQNTGVQNVRNQNGLIVVSWIANQNPNRNVAVVDLDEIEEVNANCILMANLQQASTSSTQTDKAPVYDSDGSAVVYHYDNFYNTDIFNMFTQEEQYTELLEPIPKPHQVQQNDSNVTSMVSSMEQAIEVEKVNTVNSKLRENNADLTTELARYKNQEKCFEISQEKYDKLERCYQKSIYQEQCLTKKINALHLSSGKQITTLNKEISYLNNQLSKEKSIISSLLEEKKKLKSEFKIREDELLDKQMQLENKIKELDNILVQTGQSIQTMHMLSPKPDSFYHTEQKMALGYQNPFYLKQAQQKQQSLYNGKVLLEKHDPPAMYDSEETLQLAQEIRLKMR